MMPHAYSRAERIADAVIHVIGVPTGIAALVSLLWIAAYQDSAKILIASGIYGAGIVAMLGFSAAYHLTSHAPWKEILRRLDHAAIYIMIAGSYTPFALVKLEQSWGIGLLSVVWGIALVGVVMKLSFPRRFERLSIVLYLLQGWTILIAVEPLLDAVSLSGVVLLGIGGLLYTIGVVFHLSGRLPFHNVIWHALVLAAASCHFAAVLNEVVLVPHSV
jgi:hemolysin III